jgi:hypothetical protein
VAEQVADHHGRSSLAIERDCEGVPEPVHVDTLLDLRPSSESRKEVPEVRGIERLSLQGGEDRRGAADAELASHVEPRGDQGAGASINANPP